MSTGRTAQRLRQEAWKRLSAEWKDDPEACFVFGFQAGLDAVAPRVEPPVTESGAGFESPPASAQPPDDPQALKEATHIAEWLWKTFYRDQAPEWAVLPDLLGVLSQIDNMVAGLRGLRRSEREACARVCDAHIGEDHYDMFGRDLANQCAAAIRLRRG